MARIEIPSQSVTIAIGGRHAPMAEVLDLVPATARPWDVNHPGPSAKAVGAALSDQGRVRCAMRNAHGKAVTDLARLARRHGATSILLRLPGAPDLGGALAQVDRVHDVAGPEGLSFAVVPMPCDRTDLDGPFDIIPDIHGCADEMLDLLRLLGHLGPDGRPTAHHEGRVAVLLGDYTDRGPQNRLALETAMAVTEAGGIALLGNHDAKLARWLKGADVRVAAGIETTIAELSGATPDWRARVAEWLGGLQPHVMLAGGALAVAHAGIPESLQGRMTAAARDFALYGKPMGEDERGRPIRDDWAQGYAGAAEVVHGHVIYREPRILNRVTAIDTGCVYGGPLTAYRWPERTFASVPARRAHCEPGEGTFA